MPIELRTLEPRLNCASCRRELLPKDYDDQNVVLAMGPEGIAGVCVACLENDPDEASNALAKAKALQLENARDIEIISQVWNRTPAHVRDICLRRGLRDATMFAVCRDCGCTDNDACIADNGGENCSWHSSDLCSTCAKSAAASPSQGV